MPDSLAKEWLAKLGRRPAIAVVTVIVIAVAGLAAFLKNSREIYSFFQPTPPPKPAVWRTETLEGTRWRGLEGLAANGPPFQIELFAEGKCYFTTGRFAIRDCTWELDRTNVRFRGTIPPWEPAPTPVLGVMSLDGRSLSGYVNAVNMAWIGSASIE